MAATPPPVQPTTPPPAPNAGNATVVSGGGSSKGSSRGRFMGIFAVLVLIVGVIAGVVLVGQPQFFSQKAGVANFGSVNGLAGCDAAISPDAKTTCSESRKFCTDTGCSVLESMKCEIRHYHSNDKDDNVVNDTQLNFTTNGTLSLGGQTCGAEQIDVGCYTDDDGNGEYNDGFKTVAYAWQRYTESCTTGEQPPAGDSLPQGSCQSGMVCVPPEFWASGGDADGQYDNCGEVGRPEGPGAGQACGTGGFCCGTISGGGPTPTPTPKLAVCGEACNVDSDCAASTLGVPTACRNGQCVNLSCYDDGGKTVFGTRCDCVLAHQCGAGCGASIGLCDKGLSCTYQAKSQCSSKNNGLCVPTGTEANNRGPMTGVPEFDGAPFERKQCGAGTGDPNNNYIYHPSFPNELFTKAKVLEYICNPVVASPTPTPTPPEVGAQCLDVKLYDTDWNRLTVEDLKALKPGDVIRMTVRGSTTNGNITKARFTINGAAAVETANIKPETTDEFFLEYTIPENATGLSIQAEVNHDQLGWI